MKWSPWQSTSGGKTRKLQVKVSRLELRSDFECQSENAEDVAGTKVVAIEVKWRKGTKKLVPFYGRSRRSQRNLTARRGFRRGETVAWDDDFENLCDFPPFGSDWSLVFSLLYGEREESKGKMSVVGKVSMNLIGETEIERKLPMMTKVVGGGGGGGNGVARETTLSVCVSFVELRNSQISTGIVQDSSEFDRDSVLSRLTYFRSFRKMAAKEAMASPEPQETCSDTDDSPPLLSGSGGFPASSNPDTAPNDDSTPYPSPEDTTRKDDSALSPSPEDTTRKDESELSPSPETRPEPVTKGGLLTWKRRRLGDWTVLRTQEPLTQYASGVNYATDFFGPFFHVDPFLKAESREFSGELGFACEEDWDVKELISKDRQSKLKTSLLFAPFDQRSKRAGGETACAAIAVVNAYWLHSNQDILPTRFEFSSLIIQGSIEWQRLCEQAVYIRRFPDRHFDLETVLDADIRPLAVQPEKSFIGFFNPDKFDSLKEAMSFDQIWDEMSKDTIGLEPRIYIVSWNDHFFVLKVEEDAYYIVDSLGSRLSDWCRKAYILKFDDSSVMYGNDVEVEVSEELVKPIFHGKECCREFIKRFLAAQTINELEEEDKKGMASILTLYQRLQIEFHYTYSTLPPSPSSPTDSSTLSLCSSEEFSQNLS